MTTETLYKWVPITEEMVFEPGYYHFAKNGYIHYMDHVYLNDLEIRKKNSIYDPAVFLPVQAISLEEHEKAVKDAYEKGHEHGYNQANT